MKRIIFSFFTLLLTGVNTSAATLLIPMDNSQTNHLKAYGITYWVLNNGGTANWLLNYKGGSFTLQHTTTYEEELIIRGVSYELISDAQFEEIKI